MWTQEEISQRIRDAMFLLDPEVSLEPGTPERKIVDAVSSVLAEVNIDRFVQNYTFDIDTKFGQDLDDFVGIFGFARQAAKRATGYVTFSRQTPAPAPVLIPAGTLISAPATSVSPEVTYRTVSDAVIATNQSTVRVLIEAVVAGSIGNISAGKVTAVTGLALSNVSGVINNAPISGGADQESDSELKVRFRNTVFRNIAGTMDQFLAIALSANETNRAIVIGPVSKFSEYVQIPLDGIIDSSNPHAKYIYPYNYFLSSDGTDSALLYTPEMDYTWGTATVGDGYAPIVRISNVVNTHGTVAPTVAVSGTGNLTGTNLQWAYTYVYSVGGESGLSPASGSVSPSGESVLISTIGTGSGLTNDLGGTPVARKVYRLEDEVWGLVGTLNDNTTTTYTDNIVGLGSTPPTTDLTVNKVLYLEHEYISKNSRNFIDDLNSVSILNKVDVYISGQDSEPASDVVTGPGISFVNDAQSKYYNQNYYRHSGTAAPTFPTVGNKFIQLMWTPILNIPEQLIINGVTYEKDTDYWMIKDISSLRESVRARDGLEVSAAMGTAISGNSFPVTYDFDKLPLLTQEITDRHKQVGQDVLVHTAKYRYFKVNLVIIYRTGFSKANVDQELQVALTSFFEAQKFGSILQPGDILQVVYQIPGVETARFATSFDDASHYYLEEVDSNGNHIEYFNPNLDLLLEDIELPVFYGLGPNADGPIQKTHNTWTP